MRLQFGDTQQALGFLIEQTAHIETEVYRIQYPDIQYPSLIPIDSTANEWAKSVTFFSMDRVGQAAWFNHSATDMRLADVNRAKHEQGIELAAIGYRYSLEEIGQAQMIPGTNLTSERAESARRAYEEFVDNVAFLGDYGKSWSGLINNASVTRTDAPADGTGSSRLWSAKTSDQQIRDVNDALSGVYTGSSTVEMADTVLLPNAAWLTIGNTRVANTMDTALSFLMKNNVYTMKTGQPLTIRGVLGLESAGASGTGRMVCYRKHPSVLKMHIPMIHRFLPVWQTGPITFDIPGIFRLGGLEIRRPGSVRYVDGITAAP
jgi:hypothetical protein